MGPFHKRTSTACTTLRPAVLHTQNPYSARPNQIEIGRTVPEWVMLIRNLVRDHVILMGNTAFLVPVPDRGDVTVHRATANDQPPFSTVPES